MAEGAVPTQSLVRVHCVSWAGWERQERPRKPCGVPEGGP